MDHHPLKKEFQVERLILFSDAVFAIAITLLIIEIKVPELHGMEITERNFWIAFAQLLPKFAGFVLSFFMIGLYWTVHHRMFGYVVDYDGKLMWLNLGFLFAIVLMPFSTALYSDYSTEETIHLVSPFAIYVFNIVLINAMNYWLWSYITSPKSKVAEHLPAANEIRAGKHRSIVLASVFLLSLLATWIAPAWGRMLLFLIPFAIKWVSVKKSTLTKLPH